jgi:hypothetical protein
MSWLVCPLKTNNIKAKEVFKDGESQQPALDYLEQEVL